MPQWRGTIAPRQWKKRGGGGREGYLDNRAGDRSTMAAVFSIRHYLIDRVAGLIVRGGYFRAAFVWGSAILPPPLLDPKLPTPPLLHHHTLLLQQRPCYLVYTCVCMHVCVHGLRAGLLCSLLFALHQWRAKFGQLRKVMEGGGETKHINISP